jgi:hypothetical protein
MSLRNMILENSSPDIELLVLVRTSPSLEITLSAGVEVPMMARYFLASLAMIGYSVLL